MNGELPPKLPKPGQDLKSWAAGIAVAIASAFAGWQGNETFSADDRRPRIPQWALEHIVLTYEDPDTDPAVKAFLKEFRAMAWERERIWQERHR